MLRACGTTVLMGPLRWRRPSNGSRRERPPEGVACARGSLPDCRSAQTGKGDVEGVPCPWIIITMDGARNTWNGPRLKNSRTDVPTESSLSRTGCVRGIASTSVRSSYLCPIVWEDGAGKEEAATESSDARPASDTDVVGVEARALHSGDEYQGVSNAGPQVACAATMPDASDRNVSRNKDTKNEDSGAVTLSTGPQTRNAAFAGPSPGVFFGPRNFSMRSCSNKLIGN